MLRFFAPYFSRRPMITEDPSDYVDPEAQLANSSIYNWIHPLGDLVTSLIASGLTLDLLHEHDAVPWRMFEALVEDGSGLYSWPDRPSLPLAFLLAATGRGWKKPIFDQPNPGPDRWPHRPFPAGLRELVWGVSAASAVHDLSRSRTPLSTVAHCGIGHGRRPHIWVDCIGIPAAFRRVLAASLAERHRRVTTHHRRCCCTVNQKHQLSRKTVRVWCIQPGQSLTEPEALTFLERELLFCEQDGSVRPIRRPH
jgi:hypothetical protein